MRRRNLLLLGGLAYIVGAQIQEAHPLKQGLKLDYDPAIVEVFQ